VARSSVTVGGLGIRDALYQGAVSR
jgi:hypothetical protein